MEGLRVTVERSPHPLCVHEICRAAGQDPTQPGAAFVVLAFVDRFRRRRIGTPPTLGGAGVGIRPRSWFARVPCDYFYWSLSEGRPSGPDGLARFGPDFQGAQLAARVRRHGEEFPPLYGTLGRGPPRPDLLLD